MTLVRSINGIDYVPLRAVPAMTSGVLDTPTLAEMISNPEGFCDHRYSELIAPVRYSSDGRLRQADGRVFGQLPNGRKAPQAPLFGAEQLPAGLLVRFDAVKEKYDLLMTHNMRAQRQALRTGGGGLDVSPCLSQYERNQINAGLAPDRKNSAAAARNEIWQGYLAIAAKCEAAGCSLSLKELPGTSKHWQRFIEPVVERVRNMATSTFKAHCHAVGLSWRQGLRMSDLNNVERALGLPLT